MNIFVNDDFEISNIPEWGCPACSRGILELKGNLCLKETANTIANKEHEMFESEYIEYTVAGMFRCSRKKCSETVMMAGTGFNSLDYGIVDGEWIQYLTSYCKPTFFQPHLNIFNVPYHVPKDISDMLKSSFVLFFCDSDSCGNRIRATIEMLLDTLESPRTGIGKKGKPFSINLHGRIEALTDTHKDIKELLSAIRIIGNEGSHGESSLCKKDTIESYEMVQFVLDMLYKPEADTDRIYQAARQRIGEEIASRQANKTPPLPS